MKKKGKLISALIAFVLVIACMSVLLVSCKEDKPVEPQVETQSDVEIAVNDLATAFTKTYINDGKGFGWKADIVIDDINIKSTGSIDPSDASKTGFDFNISQNGNAIDISADNEYMYVVSGESKKRLKDFQLYNVSKDAAMPNADTTKDVVGYVQLALTTLFGGDDATVTKSKPNTITGEYDITLNASLAGVADLLKGVLPSNLSGIVDKLAGQKVSFKVTLNNNTGLVTSMKLSLAGINAKINELSLNKDLKGTEFALPEGRDAFATTNALNFTLQGTFNMNQNLHGMATQDIYTMHYEIRADINVFKALREGLLKDSKGNITFDARAIFADDTNKLYVDLSHVCAVDDHGTDYCANHRLFSSVEGKESVNSKGSVLTIAYDPASFQNKNVYVSLNGRAIITKALKEADLLIADINGFQLSTGILDMAMPMFVPGTYIGVALDPVALTTNSVDPNAGAAANVATMSLTDDVNNVFNIAGIVSKVIALLPSINTTETSLSIGTPELVEFIAAAAGSDISQWIAPFLDDSDNISITVDNAEFADPTTANLNLMNRFKAINVNDVALGGKEFKFKGPLGGFDGDITPLVGEKTYTTKDGVIEIKNDNVKLYDNDGKLMPINEFEARQLFNNAKVSYTATDLYGNEVTRDADILAVYGLDYTKHNVAQNITVVTNDMHGLFGGLANSNMIGGAVGPMLSTLPGGVFNTTITISDSELLSDHKFVVDMTANKYHFGSELDPSLTLTFKYATPQAKDGEAAAEAITKDVNILPDNYNDYFDGNKIKVFKDFTLKYTYEGKEVATQAVTFDNDVKYTGVKNDKKAKAGEVFTTSDGVQLGTTTAPSTVLGVYHMSASDKITSVVFKKDDAVVDNVKYTIKDNGTVDIIFPEKGTYTVTISVEGAGVNFDMNYEVKVKDGFNPKPPVPQKKKAKYNVVEAYANDTMITASLLRREGDVDLPGVHADVVIKDGTKVVDRADYVVKVNDKVVDKVDLPAIMRNPLALEITMKDGKKLTALKEVQFVEDAVVVASTTTFKSFLEYYQTTAYAVKAEDFNTSKLQMVVLTTKVDPKYAVKGATITVKVSVATDGVNFTEAKKDSDWKYGYALSSYGEIPDGAGKVFDGNISYVTENSPGLVDVPDGLKYTANGFVEGKVFMNMMYAKQGILFTKSYDKDAKWKVEISVGTDSIAVLEGNFVA